MKPKITVETIINAPIDKIWKYWNEPEHITKWAHASDDWHAPRATNDLVVGGKSNIRMESTDGVHGFDLIGEYTAITEHKLIEYTLEDGRTVEIHFNPVEGGYRVTEIFEAESENSLDMQKSGWQAILDNFKKHVLEA
ncbi:MAG: SRPBCC domain-containing protein [Patescibacteria group bacterium]